MPAKVEVEVAIASREVGDGTKGLAREDEACLGRGWSTALYMNSKRSDGNWKIGLAGTGDGACFENLPNASAVHEYT
jgi:hypothetical protein